jgi:hypothetical protein
MQLPICTFAAASARRGDRNAQPSSREVINCDISRVADACMHLHSLSKTTVSLIIKLKQVVAVNP